MFLRALRDAAHEEPGTVNEETGSVNDEPSSAARVTPLVTELEPVYARWLDEALTEEAELQVIPIKDAAGLQYGSVLALAAHTLRQRQDLAASVSDQRAEA